MALTPEMIAKLNNQNPDAIHDFVETLPDSIEEVDRHIQLLNRQPNDALLINGLFRAVHSIKSNAAMCRLHSLVDFAHPLEDVIGEVRAGKIPYSAYVGELILLCVDRLHLAAQNLASDEDLMGLDLETIAEHLRIFSHNISAADIDQYAGHIIETISGHRPEGLAVSLRPVLAVKPSVSGDIEFFEELATSLELRNPYWEGRTHRVMQLALETNQVSGELIDAQQLQVAVYMHDVGMAFLSDSIWSKQGKYTDLDLRSMRQHPITAAQLLSRMERWQGAAEMVLQHHERLDGRGYPQGLQEAQICEGAKLLAIVDAFEAMTHERGDRYHKRSIIRAVTELNACEGQFSKTWVRHFNLVARRLFDAQNN